MDYFNNYYCYSDDTSYSDESSNEDDTDIGKISSDGVKEREDFTLVIKF